jgi:hypothetical protein
VERTDELIDREDKRAELLDAVRSGQAVMVHGPRRYEDEQRSRSIFSHSLLKLCRPLTASLLPRVARLGAPHDHTHLDVTDLPKELKANLRFLLENS